MDRGIMASYGAPLKIESNYSYASVFTHHYVNHVALTVGLIHTSLLQSCDEAAVLEWSVSIQHEIFYMLQIPQGGVFAAGWSVSGNADSCGYTYKCTMAGRTSERHRQNAIRQSRGDGL
jgi:hypothetical protein